MKGGEAYGYSNVIILANSRILYVYHICYSGLYSRRRIRGIPIWIRHIVHHIHCLDRKTYSPPQK